MDQRTSLRIGALLDREMNRRDFLKYLGLSILGFVGLDAMLRAAVPFESQPARSITYSSGTYGGRPQ